MSIYAIAIIPLVLMIMEIMSTSPDNTSKMVAYAGDFTARGTVKYLKYWCETLCELGPKFGYYPEASKTWLIVKNDFYDIANTTFKSTKINVTSNGKRHLGAVISSRSYKEDYMNGKINHWIKEVKLLSLPPKLGGLGIPIFSETSDFEYSNSKMVTKQLCEKIIQQERQYNRDNKIKEIKNKLTRTRPTRYHHILVDVRAHMNKNQQQLNDISQEPGAYSWILSLPLEDEGYVLNKTIVLGFDTY